MAVMPTCAICDLLFQNFVKNALRNRRLFELIWTTSKKKTFKKHRQALLIQKKCFCSPVLWCSIEYCIYKYVCRNRSKSNKADSHVLVGISYTLSLKFLVHSIWFHTFRDRLKMSVFSPNEYSWKTPNHCAQNKHVLVHEKVYHSPITCIANRF